MKKLVLSLLAAVCALLLAACAQEEPSGENVYQVYYVSKSEMKVEQRACEIQADSYEGRLQELLELLAATPE
ncbi:hypothetical protein DK853_45925, partial [Klebsiella oxytoca]